MFLLLAAFVDVTLLALMVVTLKIEISLLANEFTVKANTSCFLELTVQTLAWRKDKRGYD